MVLLATGAEGPPRASPRQVSEVVLASRSKPKLKYVGEGPDQVVYVARSSSPKVPPEGLVAAPLQVGRGRVELHVFIFLF